MKSSKLLAVLLVPAFVFGCANLGGASGDKSASKQRSAGEIVDDATITSRVKTALLADPEISGLKINVDTVEGKVSLKGETKTLALRKKAESIARSVPGVRSVTNNLVVTG